MAQKNHLALLKNGADAWNRWRKNDPRSRPDLSKVKMKGRNLSKFNLTNVVFDGAELDNVKLAEATLDGASLKKAWVFQANMFRVSAQGANLENIALDGCDLSSVNFSGANLSGASMRECDMWGTRFTGATLIGATCSNSVMRRVDFTDADVTDMGLTGSVIANTDLSTARNPEAFKANAPASLSLETLLASYKSLSPELLWACGVPEGLVDYIPSFTRRPFELHSCFISHSSQDDDFASQLCADLRKADVRVWYFPEDAKWGQSVWGEIDNSIALFDRTIVVCSAQSLRSGPVLREIERALNREDVEGRPVLFPIRLDNYIFDGWNHPRKADVTAKVVGDFSEWRAKGDYTAAVRKLVLALRGRKVTSIVFDDVVAVFEG